VADLGDLGGRSDGVGVGSEGAEGIGEVDIVNSLFDPLDSRFFFAVSFNLSHLR
jgi:hypothetical protein